MAPFCVWGGFMVNYCLKHYVSTAPRQKSFAELLGKRPPPHAAFFFWELFFLRLWLQKEKWISSLGVKKSVYR